MCSFISCRDEKYEHVQSEQSDGELDGQVTIQERCKGLLALQEMGMGCR